MTDGPTGDERSPGQALSRIVAERSIIVCCGSGGVGKTTAAAVLAAEAAEQGRRAVVVTIDPARRLADALGLGAAGGLTNEPALVPRADTSGAGELWAAMLDTKMTFDRLVELYSPDPAQAEKIKGNTFYRNISGALSGTQEYMAAEKLYELHADERFELVVVDTPPTRNALNFLEAPARLTRFLDHRLYRALTAPTRVGLRAVNVAAQALLRTLSRVVGSDAITDAVAFFQAFEGMEDGFRQRADDVDRLLKSRRDGLRPGHGATAGHRRGGALLRPAPDRQRHPAGGRDRQPRAPSVPPRSVRVAPAAERRRPGCARGARSQLGRAAGGGRRRGGRAGAAHRPPGRRPGRDGPAAGYRRP